MRKYLCLLIILLVTTCLSAKVYKGKCGKDVNWHYISDTRTLYVMGNGTMDDYGAYIIKDKKTPWRKFTGLRKVIICDGVKSIGRHAFEECANLERVTFPKEKKCYISAYAFCNCNKLDSVVITEAITTIGEKAFAACDSLRTLSFKEGIKSMSYLCFGGTRIERVILPSSLNSLVNPFGCCDSLSWIDVSKENNFFSSVDGRLCSKDSTVLYILPNNELGRLEIIKENKKHWQDIYYSFLELLEDGSIELDSTILKAFKALESREKLLTEKGILVIDSNPIREIGMNAIDGVKGVKHLVILEGIEKFGCHAIRGGQNLKSIYFPSTLKNFVDKDRLCIGGRLEGLQQVFIASEEPEQLFQSSVSNTNSSHFIKYCWASLISLSGDKDARKTCVWYVPRSAYSRYKNHPCWGQLNLKAVDCFEKTKNIYWEEGDKFFNIYFF